MKNIAIALAAASLLASTAVAVAQAPGTAPDSPGGGQVRKMLDEPAAAVTFQQTPLLEVLGRLEGDVRGWIVVPPRTLACLPYGQATTVAAALPAAKRSEQIEQLLAPLSLRSRLVESGEAGRLVIEPMPELVRIGRRATIDEVGLLHDLRTVRLRPWQGLPHVQFEQATGRQIRIDFDLSALDGLGAARKFREAASKMPESTLANMLDQFCTGGPWTWRVEGKTVRIVDRTKQIVYQLGRPIGVNWRDEPLDQALIELASQAGVLAQFQPGAMESLGQGGKRITWQVSDLPTLQIIEALAARTGLGYEVREDSVYFYSSRGGSSWASDPIVGMLTVPSKTAGFEFRVAIRKSMLPKEAQEAYQRQVQKAIEELAKDLESMPAGR